ncbi:MAG: glycosyltransferase family 2 protein [Pseudomonadota bacterium]
MPRISILMPVYNGMPYIPEAVESVLAQDEQDWELVISDNGSTDSTRDYLSTLQDPRIRVHLQQANLGIFGNLNFLLAQAQASIAKILCADDKLLPGALARIAAFMEERPWCAVSRCWADGDARRFQPGQRDELIGALPSRISPEAALLMFATFGNIVGNLSKAACRPQLVLEQGGFDQGFPYAGDYEGWMRVSERYGLALQDVELIFERRHAAQNSSLLNRSNELFPQLTKLIEMLATKVPSGDLALFKRHWTIHFLAQRLPKLARQAMAGEYGLARAGLTNLPLGISPIAVIAAYPILKFNLPPARATTRKLFARIVAINGAST